MEKEPMSKEEMKVRYRPRGPWTQRVGVVVFTVLTGMLVFWLLDFVVDDIGQKRGPDRASVEKSELDPIVVGQLQAVDKQIAALVSSVENLKARQVLLRDSTTSSQQTMNQLLDMDRQKIQNHVQASEAEQKALAQSENLFLANQSQYQGLNEQISSRSENLRSLNEQRQRLDAQLAGQRDRADKKFAELDREHRLRVAGLQLLFLIPILMSAFYFILRWRHTIYAPLIFAYGVTTLAEVVIVIHRCFPTRYFKYVLLLAALAVVVRVLVYLIRATASPKMAALLKHYREAYELFLCPICEYPIRRGPMRYSFWDRRSIHKLLPRVLTTPTPQELYACPSCGSHLFEACSNCSDIRPSLLPFCDHCGKEKAFASPDAA